MGYDSRPRREAEVSGISAGGSRAIFVIVNQLVIGDYLLRPLV